MQVVAVKSHFLQLYEFFKVTKGSVMLLNTLGNFSFL